MRKFFVALSVLLLVAVVILKVAIAQDPVKKAAPETKKECCKPATAKECPMMTAAKEGEAKACDHAKTTEMSADCKSKAEGCKGATAEAKAECCKGVTAEAKAEAKPCCAK
jgi:hypothetical protein